MTPQGNTGRGADWAPQVPLAPLRPSDPGQFGRFRALGRLGSGGLGDAYLAQDANQWVVVKAVHAGMENMLALRARMEREITAMQRIQSPRVAAVITADVNAERPWFAMQYVPGVTLERWVDEHGPARAAQLLAISDGIAEALAAVAAAGVVHRDLKPANIMMSPEGPVLIDFGVADVAEATKLTQVGSSIGTLSWMAPEQVAGDPVTAATDVHAWGLVVTFLATGQLPFAGSNAAAVMYQILNVMPALPRDIPPALGNLVVGALAKQPRARPSISEVHATLAGLAADPRAGAVGSAGSAQPAPTGPTYPAPPPPGPPPGQYPPPPSGPPVAGYPGPGWAPGSGPSPAALPARQPPPRRAGAPTAILVGAGALLLAALALVAVLVLRPDRAPDTAGETSATPTVTSTVTVTPSTTSPTAPDLGVDAPPIDATGTWNGSSTSVDGDSVYQVSVELAGNPENPEGTVSMRNVSSGNEGSWEVSGSWEDGQLILMPGLWIARPNDSWTQEALYLVALTDNRLNGTTANPDSPGDPTGNVDLYR